jgi:hypothetical protein
MRQMRRVLVLLMVDMMIYVCPLKRTMTQAKKQNEVNVIGCIKLPMRMKVSVKH